MNDMHSQAFVVGLIACVILTLSGETRADPASPGHALAQSHCVACHAVGVDDRSANADAPPLRTLSARYDVSTLQEALAEGITVGHPAMPELQFSPDEVAALIAYLETIQEEPERRAEPIP